MPKSDQVEKKRLIVDGEELEGLINISEYVIAYGTETVPGFNKNTPVSNGVKDVPPIDAVYKLGLNTKTFAILQDWFDTKETKDVVCVRLNGKGKEFGRELWRNVELSKFHSGAYDASAPTTAQQLVTFLPEDIVLIDPEG